jgi:hypothetical protein
MAGLVPAIHVLLFSDPQRPFKTWMPGTRLRRGFDGPGHQSRARRSSSEGGKAGHDELEADASLTPEEVYVAFFEANVDRRLSNNSTFTPLRRMMKLCCITDSVLFHAQ